MGHGTSFHRFDGGWRGLQKRLFGVPKLEDANMAGTKEATVLSVRARSFVEAFFVWELLLRRWKTTQQIYEKIGKVKTNFCGFWGHVGDVYQLLQSFPT